MPAQTKPQNTHCHLYIFLKTMGLASLLSGNDWQRFLGLLSVW